MNRKQSIHHANVDINLREENAIEINGEIMINVDVSVKHIMNVKSLESCYMLLQKWKCYGKFSNYV